MQLMGSPPWGMWVKTTYRSSYMHFLAYCTTARWRSFCPTWRFWMTEGPALHPPQLQTRQMQICRGSQMLLWTLRTFHKNNNNQTKRSRQTSTDPLDLPFTCGSVILTAVGNNFLRSFTDVAEDILLTYNLLFGFAAAGQKRGDHVKLTSR